MQNNAIDQTAPVPKFRLGNLLLKALFFSLLFFPKINIFSLPGLNVAAKIEDIIWALLVISSLKYRNRLGNTSSLIFFTLITYVSLSAFLFPGNIVLAARLFFYALPIVVFFAFSREDFNFVIMLFKTFARVFGLVAILQVTTPFIFFHTGELYIGVSERAPGIFGNGVEFALIAFMALWVLRFLNHLTFFDYCLLFVIGFCSGSRVAMAGIIISGLIIFGRQYSLRFLFAAPLILLAAGPFIYLIEGSRFMELNFFNLISSVQSLVGSISSKELLDTDIGNYCFSFNDDLSDDQSFAMRLAKAKFVLEYVVIGAHPLGFGLGNCIGDAGDNLFVRVLSDGGYPYFLLLILFFFTLFITKKFHQISPEWKYFIILFIGLSLFYDTLYFSRVAPLFFLIIFLIYERQRGLGI